MSAAAKILSKYGAVRVREFLNILPAGFEYWSPEKQIVINLTETTKFLEDSLVMRSWVHIPELQRLVDSHEMVLVWRMPPSWRRDCDGDEFGWHGAGMYLNMSEPDLKPDEIARFKQALDDVWLCQMSTEMEPAE